MGYFVISSTSLKINCKKLKKEWKFRVMKLSRPPIHISASNWIKIKILCDTTNLIIFFLMNYFFQPALFFNQQSFYVIENFVIFLIPILSCNQTAKNQAKKKKEIFDSSFTSFFFLLLFLSLWIYSFELKNIEWKIEVLRNTRIEIFLARFVSEIFRTKLQKIKRRKK